MKSITYLPSLGMGRSKKESGGGMEGAFPFYWLTRNTIIDAEQNNLLNTRKQTELQGPRFNKEVQPTRSLNLNSELTYSEMENSEFSVTEQLNCV